MDGKNEDTDITPHPHSDTYFLRLPRIGGKDQFFLRYYKGLLSRSPSSHTSSSKLTW